MRLSYYAAVVVASVAAPVVFELVDGARHRARMQLKELAIEMGISESQLSRQLRGQEHLQFDRVMGCRAAFLRELAHGVLELIGERPVTAREVLDLVQPMMARMTAPVADRAKERRLSWL